MDFFATELKAVMSLVKDVTYVKYVGGAAYGKVNDNLRVKVEFAKNGCYNEYVFLRLSIINPNDGVVDCINVHLATVLNKVLQCATVYIYFPGNSMADPYWCVRCADGANRSLVKMNAAMAKALAASVTDYVRVFK